MHKLRRGAHTRQMQSDTSSVLEVSPFHWFRFTLSRSVTRSVDLDLRRSSILRKPEEHTKPEIRRDKRDNVGVPDAVGCRVVSNQLIDGCPVVHDSNQFTPFFFLSP